MFDLTLGRAATRNRRAPAVGAIVLGALAATTLTAGVAAAAPAKAVVKYMNGFTKFGTPRTADGHPDWTGLWDTTDTMAFDPATADPPGNNAQGLRDRIHPPYNAEWEARYTAILDDHVKKDIVTDPINLCQPHGFPRVLGGKRGPVQFIVTPVMFQMQWDSQSQVHRVSMNVPHPGPDDVWDTPMGDAVGHWEGETLVVDSIASKAGQFDRTGAPYSNKIHTVEHIRQIDADTLEDQITLEDPVAFTKPWHVTRRFKRAPSDLKLIDDFCTENNRNPVVNGVPTTVLGSELEAQAGR
jgi:hypothetical protein